MTEAYEYISTPNEEDRDQFDTLPKGAHGTIVGTYFDPKATGCYVEFPQITEKYPDADPVTWVEWTQLKHAK